MTPPPSPHVNFVLEFSHLCKGSEIPELFAVWGGLSAVSATLGRRIWIDMGFFTIYPNLYVLLCAPSGRYRKSTVINLATELLRPVKPPINFIAQSLSKEALIGALLAGQKRFQGPSGEEYRCEGFVIADELSTFLNKKSYDLGIAPPLIQFFDCTTRFEYETKARGKEILRNVCLGLFAGSTMEWIRNAIPADAIGGGLTSRFIFIYTKDLPEPVPRPKLSQEQKTMKGKLSEVLGVIRALQGEVALSPSATERYDSAYIDHCKTSPFFILPVLSGYASRWHKHMLSIAMLLTVSEFPTVMPVTIHLRHVDAAMAILKVSEVHMPKILTLITSTERGAQGELLAGKIEAVEGGVGRPDLMRSVAHKMTIREFDELISTLVASGRIIRVTGPGEIRYVAKD